MRGVFDKEVYFRYPVFGDGVGADEGRHGYFFVRFEAGKKIGHACGVDFVEHHELGALFIGLAFKRV